MQYRSLGSTGLQVSEIGFGCASWWGLAAFSEKDAFALVDYALDQGVTLFDTSPAYSGGNAEPRLGRVLKGRQTERLVIATKAGTRFEAGRVRRDMTLPAIEADIIRSLRVLGLETLPIVQLHGPALEELTPEFLGGLLDLKRRGMFRALGATSFDPKVLDAVIASSAFDVVMMDFNVLRPERRDLAIAANRAGKGVLAGMPLAMGHTDLQILKVRSLRDLWYAARALKNHRSEVAEGLRFQFLHRQRDMTGAQAALAYVLGHGEISSAVVGTTRMAHLRENLSASGMRLGPELLSRISAAQQGR